MSFDLYPEERLAVQARVAHELGLGYHPKQEEFLSVDSPIKFLRGARRSAKSVTGERFTLNNFAWSCRTAPLKGTATPWRGMVLAPTEQQFGEIWDDYIAYIPDSWLAAKPKASNKEILLKGSELRPVGLLEFRSADRPKDLQARGLNSLHVTEAENIKQPAWENVLPMLISPGRAGETLVEGMPNEWPSHWFNKACDQSLAGLPMTYTDRWIYTDNPFLTDDDRFLIEVVHRALMSDSAWRLMYLAEVSDTAPYFANYAQCLFGDLRDEPMREQRYVAGVDIGRRQDPSVLFVMDAAQRRVAQWYEWTTDDSWSTQRDDIFNLWQKWGFEKLVVDATGMGGDMYCESLEDMGIPVERYVISPNSRKNLIYGLSVAIDRRTVLFPHIQRLEDELRGFRPTILPSGNVRMQAAPGQQDEAVFALALALFACDPHREQAQLLARGRSRSYTDRPGRPRRRGRYTPLDQAIEKLKAAQYEDILEKMGITDG